MNHITDSDAQLIAECIQDWRNGKITDLTAMMIVSNIVFPAPVTEKDFEWGEEQLKRWTENKIPYRGILADLSDGKLT